MSNDTQGLSKLRMQDTSRWLLNALGSLYAHNPTLGRTFTNRSGDGSHQQKVGSMHERCQQAGHGLQESALTCSSRALEGMKHMASLQEAALLAADLMVLSEPLEHSKSMTRLQKAASLRPACLCLLEPAGCSKRLAPPQEAAFLRMAHFCSLEPPGSLNRVASLHEGEALKTPH